jgi:long-chain fatty acid transport protein
MCQSTHHYRLLYRGLLFVTFCLYGSNAWCNFALTPYIGDFNHSRAGGAAIAEDATTVYTNPAGLTRLSGENFSGAAQYFMTSASFSDYGSKDVFGSPLNGGNTGDGSGNTFVPALYYSRQLNDEMSFGFAINGSFGLSTDYARDWVGRYTAITTSIMALNINPSLGIKLNDAWSAGVGISAQRTQSTLSSAIDFGAVCLANLDPTTCASLGMPAPQSADGFVELKGEDWGTGYNAGLLWSAGSSESSNATRLGMSYRSRVSYHLTGDASFAVPAGAAAFNPAFTNTTVTIPLTLPEILSLSIYHDWSSTISVMADITRTRWSRFQKLEFQFANPAQPDQVIQKDWHDTTRYAIGFDYRHDASWLLQGGVAYERSPIPDTRYDPSVPVGDMLWLSLGAQYRFSDARRLNFGWMRVHVQQREVDLGGNYGETLHGNTDTQLDVFNVCLNWAF